MKAIKVIVAISLVLSMLAMPVFAAEFVPSKERGDGAELISYVLEEVDTPCRSVHLIPFGKIHFEDFFDEETIGWTEEFSKKVEEFIRADLKAAYEEFENSSLTELIHGFEAAWEKLTGGAPLENAVVHDLFEIVLVCSVDEIIITDESVTVKFTVDGITADDLFLIAHKPTGSEDWVLEDYTIDENGVITMTVDHLSPFAIIKDSGEAPEATVTSPQTGVNDYTAAAVIAAVVLSGCAVVCCKKIRRVSAQ